jgi:DNA integrity scanning protein DisA with diadenylate cyclase activity
MMPATNNDVFVPMVETAIQLAHASAADAVMLLWDDDPQREGFNDVQRLEWLKQRVDQVMIVVVGTSDELLREAAGHGLAHIKLESPEATIHDRLTHSILDAVAAEYLRPGANVVAVYSSFNVDQFDSISVVQLTSHLGRLTARDLQKLETKVPLETLKRVVELAVEIGREGREGQPVGTMLVVGDHRKVLAQSQPAGFDPMKGYTRKQRNLRDYRVCEGIKEIAQLDGAFIIAADGTVESSCRIIDTDPVELTMTTGLGSRHYAGAAISKNTEAIAVVVSQSSGTVRIFQNGEVVLRIEPMQRAMKWSDAPMRKAQR